MNLKDVLIVAVAGVAAYFIFTSGGPGLGGAPPRYAPDPAPRQPLPAPRNPVQDIVGNLAANAAGQLLSNAQDALGGFFSMIGLGPGNGGLEDGGVSG